MTYQQTGVRFEEWDLPMLLAIPDALRPEHVSVEADRYRTFNDVVAAAQQGYIALRGKISTAVEGAAAAVLSELTRLDGLADAGQQQSDQANRALLDHAGQVASAGSELGWVQTLAVPARVAAGVVIQPAGHVVDAGAHWFAADIANQYQDTSNMNYASTYPAPDPPGVSPVQAAAAGGGIGGASGGVVGAAAVGSAIPEIGQAGAMPGAGVPGGVPGGAGPGGPVAGGGAPGLPGGGAGGWAGPGFGPVGVPGGGPGSRPSGSGRGVSGARPGVPGPRPTLPPGAGLGRPGMSSGGRAGPPPPGARPGGGTEWGRGGSGGVGGPGNRGAGGDRGGVGGGHGGAGRLPASGPSPGGPASPGAGGAGAGGGRGAGVGGVPLGAGAGAGRSDEVHQRPPWLLEDDADSIWFAGLPEYCDPVIGGEPHARVPDQHR